MSVDLADYDVILANSSGGKDSQAMLDILVEMADRAAVRYRMVVAHADLGRVEWEGTRELAQEHAEHYGLRFEAIARPQGDLLAHIEDRGMFPSSQARYCTSDHKTGQVAKIMTKLVHELALSRPARILNCLGIRAQESKARAKKPVFSVDTAASTKTTRHVDRWLPIHGWTTEQVWARNAQAGTRHHVAYDQGMPRLSCSFCVLASKSALVLAAKLRPELAAEYAAVEHRIDHRFRNDLSMADIIEAAKRDDVQPVENWSA